MAEFTTRDGTQIFFKDWGSGEPIVFSHGWPLSADDWDAQMMFFLHHGYRVIAHDRRGHGRSAQVSEGNDIDHYADDLADLTQHLDLHDAVHIGHSAGGGEVARYVGRHGESRVAKVVLVSAVTPSVLQTDANAGQRAQGGLRGLSSGAGGEPLGVLRAVASGHSTTSASRAWTLPSRSSRTGGARGVMSSAKGQYECVSEFIRQDYSEDLKKITVPVLAMNGDGDQVVPASAWGPRAVELVQNGTLKTYRASTWMTTHADVLTPRLAGLYPVLVIVLARGRR